MSDESIKNDTLNNSGAPEEAGQEENFAAMLEKSSSPAMRLGPGQRVKTKVIGITGDAVYVDLGGKSDGVIDLSEFKDEQGVSRVKEGDEVEAYFLSVQDGIRHLTILRNGYSSQKLNAVKDAFESGLAVNGEVKAEVKGGFEVSIGGVRCFCPLSQIDLRGKLESAAYLKQTFPFKVLEYKNDGRNIVVSRRVLLEQQREEQLASLKATLSIGAEVKGRVRSLQKFGVFVDLGGIDGLIPMSELSWAKVDKAGDVVSIGQEVTVKIIALDWDANRLSLSLKALQPDPWSTATEKYPEGSKVNGTIVRLAPFGAFVSVETGIDGLIHISNLGAGRRINHPKEVVEAGQQVETYVLAVDPQNRKLSLSMQPKRESKKIELPPVGDRFNGVVEKVMPFGVFVKNSNGLTGLIPNSEMGTARGADHSTMFPVGSEMQTIVLEVDQEKGKVLLSRKGIIDKAEQEELKQYRDSLKEEEKSSNGLSTLGEMLKAKMEEKKITFK